jgi:formyl-CoA transferase
MVALLEREESGRGQWVSTSLLQAQIAMLDFQAARWTMTGEVPPQAGNNHPTSIPTGVFQTTDGHVNVATTGEIMFVKLCEVLGMPELATDQRYRTAAARLENRDQLNAALQEGFAGGSSEHWVTAMNDAGVPCGPIYSIDQVFEDPQVKQLGMAHTVDHPVLGEIDIVSNAVDLSRAPHERYQPTPERGQHTDEVLAEFGYSEDEIRDLRAAGVI